MLNQLRMKLFIAILILMVSMALIKFVKDQNTTTEREEIMITYTTVTHGYDWGPAVDQIILSFGAQIDPNTVKPENFIVDVTSSNQTARRIITAAYISDASGVATSEGSHVTLALEVGPTLYESSPFNYDFMSGRNLYKEMNYTLALTPESTLATKSGERITWTSDTPIEKTADLMPYSDLFVHNQDFKLAEVSLKYASYTPTTQDSENNDTKIPLIIWLHGAGEGGTDTTIAVLGNNVTNLVQDEIQSHFGEQGTYVLVPQAPTMWMDVNGQNVYNISVKDSDGKSYYEEALMALIEQFVTSHPDIDTNRIYIGGCSNGGYMTVKMIIDYPDYFAAAYPAAMAYASDWLNEDRLNALMDMPIWLTHAQNDPTVKISEDVKDANGAYIPVDNFSNALYDRLVQKGHKNIHYSLYDTVVDTSGNYVTPEGKPFEYNGHWSWIYTLNDDCTAVIDGTETTLFQWLAMQRN